MGARGPWLDMNDEARKPPRPRQPKNGGEDQELSGFGVLLIFVVLAVVCVAGYFLLMKLVDISRQEDCLLAGRRNCASIQVPSNR